MWNDDGGTGSRVVGGSVDVSALADRRMVSWLTDDTASCGDSATLPSPDTAALVTVTAVEIVSTVGDGEGTRRETAPTELFTSSPFLSSEGSGSGRDGAASGSSTAGADATADSDDEREDIDIRDSGALSSPDLLLSADVARGRFAVPLGPGKPSVDASSSNPGGGPCRLTSDAEAYATASGPYGTPNLLTDSTDEMSLSCSGVGPERGYTKSVRTAVCVSGAEIEVIEIIDGEVSPPVTLAIERECVRDATRPNAEEVLLRTEPEFDGIVRWLMGGERVRPGRLDRLDGRGEGETAISRDGREWD